MKVFEKVFIIAAAAVGGIAIVLVLTFALSAGGDKAGRTLAPYRAPREEEALVTCVSGGVYLYRGAQWKAVEVGELVTADDFLKTFENAYCDVQIGSGVVFSVLENTAVKLSAVLHSAPGLTGDSELLFGSLLCRAQKLVGGQTVRVRVGARAFGVRGTEFLIQRQGGTLVCAVKEGRVAVQTADGAVPEMIVARGQEISIDETSARAPVPGPLSRPRQALLDKPAAVALVDVDPEREAGLVKLGIEAEPASAEIHVDGRLAGYGSFAGIYPVGTYLSVAVRKNGYKEVSYTLQVKAGDNRIYKFPPLELDAPETGTLPNAVNGADERKIKRLEEEARQAAEEKEALQAGLETLQKEKDALSRQLEDANRKIKEAQRLLQ